MQTTLTLLLFLTAAFSPLLTFTYLWQVKEWRLDRMLDHLQSEGVLRQLFGVVRLPVVAIALVTEASGVLPPDFSSRAALWILAGLSVLQIELRRQPRPVWTAKAKMITGASAWLTAVMGLMLIALGYPASVLLPVAALLQPAVVGAVWTLLLPVDTALKRRIIEKAKAERRKHPDLLVIGITGSVGKTTTKELIACALGDRAIATPAYVNSEIGVARWMVQKLPVQTAFGPGGQATSSELQASQQEDEPGTSPQKIFIVEMGAYRRGEIALLCEIAHPQIGVVTFIGTQHIALFSTPDNLLHAKGELVRALPPDGHAFLNVDSPLTARLSTQSPCPVTTVSTGGPSDLEAYDIEETTRGVRLRVGDTPFALPLHGTHNVGNVLLAIAVAEHLDVPRSVIAERLSRFAPLSGTFSVEERNGVMVLNDTHNCSPESATAAVTWADGCPATEKVLLTSGIIEQGRHTEDVHRSLGKLSAPVFDRAVFLNKKFSQFFSQGFGKEAEMISEDSRPVKPGGLLVALGRMPKSAIERLLPKQGD